MSYEKVNWSETTPINVANLNKMEQGIDKARNVQMGAYWHNGGTGLYHYEGQNVTEYKLPDSLCEIIVTMSGINRGTAIAIRWEQNSYKMWINKLHDDSGNYNWSGWVEIPTIDQINGTVLYEDYSITSMGEQELVLNDSLENYRYYEVWVSRYQNTNSWISTGKIPINCNAFVASVEGVNYFRDIIVNNNKLSVSQCNVSTGAVENVRCIPRKIIGYK